MPAHAITFDVLGNWPRDRVRIRWIESTRAIEPQVEHQIDEAWRIALLRPGITLFDGRMCRLESFQASEDLLELAMSPTSYKTFFGTNLSHPTLADRFGGRVLANAVGVSPAVETADGFLMLGHRNGSVAYHPNRIHPFSGALEPREAADVFAGVTRELSEELGFTPAEISEMRCLGIAKDTELRQPELIFSVRSTLTRGQIERNLEPTEHRGTWSIPAEKSAVEKILRDPRELTPIAVASLLLWGRQRIGLEWFESIFRPA